MFVVDIDECAGGHTCGSAGNACVNLDGSYTCTCTAGFKADPKIPVAGGPSTCIGKVSFSKH